MKHFKFQRAIWTFSGICFLSAFLLNLIEGKNHSLIYVCQAIAAIASFLNAYQAHKKIVKE
nr:hypothetical protein [uncultured Caproiciproducens sp.]